MQQHKDRSGHRQADYNQKHYLTSTQSLLFIFRSKREKNLRIEKDFRYDVGDEFSKLTLRWMNFSMTSAYKYDAAAQ